MSCLLRAVFLELKFSFSRNYRIPSCETNPGTQTANNLGERPPVGLSEIFSEKKTISHVADTHELAGSNPLSSKEFDTLNLNMKKSNLRATNEVLAPKGKNVSNV